MATAVEYSMTPDVAPAPVAAQLTAVVPAAASALELVRRLDWRFLLPDPSLGDVVHCGLKPGMLLDALRLFAGRVGPLRERSVLGPSCDLGVAINPSAVKLARMADLVRAGGGLYIEAERERWTLSSARAGARPLRTASAYLHECRRLGLVDVTLYWTWPNRENCLELIPCNPGAIRCALKRRSRSLVNRLACLLIGQCARWGIWEGIVPSFCVVALKPAARAPE